MRILSKLILVVAVAASIVLSGTPGQTHAQQQSDKLTVLILDRQSISSDKTTIDLVKSLLGLMFRLKEGQPFVFIFSDDISETYGPLETDAEAFRHLRTTVEALIEAPPPAEALNLVATLAETYNYLSGLSVSPETTIYLFTGNTEVTDTSDALNMMEPILNVVVDAGWPVFNVTKPEIDPGFKAVLDEIALKTGGESFELSIPNGLEELTDRTLIREGKGSLQHIGFTTLSPDAVFETHIDVVPGTAAVNMIFFREDDVTSFRLKNPSGFEASSGDRKSSSTIEYSNIVIWELVEPAPGRWALEVRGDSGLLSANRYSDNRYRLELQSFGAIPVGMPVTLVASVTDGEELISVDAGLLARITDPSGTSVLYDLNDEGTGGDAVAGDGYFSATIPPVSIDGTYDVELQLWWPDISHTVTKRSSFEARLFPGVTFDEVPVEKLDLGMRTKIGALTVTIGSQPFAVSERDLIDSVTTNEGDPGIVEIVPLQIISDGKAFEFDVFYTAQSESITTVVISLDIAYAERQFSDSTDPIVISSIPPAPPRQPPAAPATPVPAPTTPPPPDILRPPADTGVPTAVVVVLGAIGAIVLALLVYWLTKPTPFGSIYTEEDRLVANLASLERTTLRNIMSRDRVQGDELDVPGFEAVMFRFTRGTVIIEPTEIATSTVRLNNQPVTVATEVHDGSWIGAMGRLYTFRFERPGA